MTITVEKENFLNAIKAVKTATSKASLQPVLQTINLKTKNGSLILTATDCSNIAQMVIEANTKDEIDICINAEKLDAIVSRLEEIITIDIEGATAIIKSGKTKFKCLYIEGSEFPDTKIELKGEKIILSANDFIDGVNKTCFAPINDNIQNIISGIYFEFNDDSYEMAATDGNRLCQVVFDVATGNNSKYTIPKNALTCVAKVIKNDVEIYFDSPLVIFRAENFIYQTRLHNGVFPQYKQLIPTKFKVSVAIDKDDFIKALDNVSIMANERTNILKLVFKENEIEFNTQCSQGDAKDKIEVDYNAEPFEIAFNYHYLMEGVKAMKSDVICMNINSNSSAVVINADFVYLVMPIKIQSIRG